MLPLAALHTTDAPTKRVSILTLDFQERTGFLLSKNGGMANSGQFIAARFEGHGTGRENLAIVNDPALGIGRALHYLCGPQQPGDIKARQEHYLHVASMNGTFFSEFSIKLDRDFTPVKTKRPDGGPNWCVLRQWHQSAPESPPIALNIVPGTRDILRWEIIFGDSKGHGTHSRELWKHKTELDRWYHFRVQWNVSPDDNGRLIVLMSDRKLPRDLTKADTLFSYAGPIGYTLKSTPDPAADTKSGHNRRNIREQQGIYQGPHLDPSSHHGYCIGNVAIYQLATESR